MYRYYVPYISKSHNTSVQLYMQLFGATIGEKQSETPIHSPSAFNWFPTTVAANSGMKSCVGYCGFKLTKVREVSKR